MSWRRILAYITGTVDDELRLRNEYLAAENRILRSKLPKRVPLDDSERMTLGRIGEMSKDLCRHRGEFAWILASRPWATSGQPPANPRSHSLTYATLATHAPRSPDRRRIRRAPSSHD